MLKNQLSLIHVLFALLLVAALAVPAANPVQGASISVTTFKDELNSNGNCSLREAIVAANTDRRVDKCPAGAGVDTIYLKSGTYNLSIAGLNEDSARTGDLDLTSGIKINGAGRTATLINANGLDRIFDVLPGLTAEISNLVVQKGNVAQASTHHGGGIRNAGNLTLYKVRVTESRTGELDYSSGNDERGAGVYSTGTLTASHTYFDFNHNDEKGGGVAGSGKLTFVESRFADNNSGAGGGLYIFGAGTVVTIDDSKFIRNNSEEGMAAAIFVEEGSKLTGTRILFDQNKAYQHGGIVWNRGDTLIRYSTFTSNPSGFGAVYNQTGSLKVFFSYLAGNDAPSIVGIESGTVFIDRTTFFSNRGPIACVNSGTVRMTNSTVHAQEYKLPLEDFCRSAAFAVGGSGRLELVNVTEAVTEAAVVSDDPTLVVYSGGSAFIHNSILTNCHVDPSLQVSGGYNIIRNGDGCNWPAAAGDQVGTADAPVDPRFQLVGYSGNYTTVLELLPGSPAIDTADPAMCFRSDQRLTPRPQGPRCDIGAVEYVPDGAAYPAPAMEVLSEEPAP